MRNQTSDSKLETKLTSSSLNGSLDTAGSVASNLDND